MIFNLEEYRKKILGCWMGKNIGGTLGAPDEWARQKNNLSFYKQELDGNPLPNDDLDIQLLWLIALEEQGININSNILSEYFSLYVTPHWAEYGIAKINMKRGLTPPLCGTENNDFKDSCGAYIRSEIWACIAPGYPEVAVRYAFEDATLDHGNGEGVYAEVFCAALESAAFVERDIRKLIEIGLSYIPEDCGVAGAVRNAIGSFESGLSWEEARDEILSKFRGKFFAYWKQISKEDVEKGFDGGKLGWDAPSNIGIIIIGLLYGRGDFGNSLCTAVNCGEDTDCTAATIGAIFGIINGIDAIPQKWIEPIGSTIKTAFLNLGELEDPASTLPKRWQVQKDRQRKPDKVGVRRLVPDNIDVLTARVIKVAKQVILSNNLDIDIDNDKLTDLSDLNKELLFAGSNNKRIYEYLNGPVFSFAFFEIFLDYGADAQVVDGEPKKIKVRIENKYKIPATINFHWYTPEGWNVSPSKNGQLYIPHGWMKDCVEMEFMLSAEKVSDSVNRFVIEMTVDGRNTVMLVPVLLLNGNYGK
jgi:ADP-ribosylglycohydrolase